MADTTGVKAAGTRRILVVDDDEDLALLLKRRLDRDGFHSEVVHSVGALREKLVGDHADAVVVDLNLGAEDGLQAIEVIAAARFVGLVVLISGSDDRVLTAAQRHAENLGLNTIGNLRKPFSPTDLSQVLLLALGSARPTAVSDVAEAIERGAISAFFQPQFDLKSGALVGAEALARWRLHDGRVLPPADFLPFVDEGKLWLPLAHRMVIETVNALSEWQAAGLAPVPVYVNLDGGLTNNGEFGPWVNALMAERGLDHQLLGFEVTEQNAMADVQASLRTLTWLRIKGFDLALDDFGTGFSSLAALHQMPFSELKVDMSFVRRMLTDPDARTIVKVIVDLAHNMGMRCIAEGIENIEARDILVSLGCDRGQGWLFSPAVTKAQFADSFLKKRVLL